MSYMPASSDDDDYQEEEEEVEQECCGFGFQYVNRLMLLAVSATSLMAWDAFFNLINPTHNLDKWDIWRLILFTIGMFLLLMLMGFYYSRHQKNLSAAAKTALSDDVKDDLEDEGAALVEQSYANLTNAIGYTIVGVWLNVYPIPDDFTYWFIGLMFLIVLLVVFLFEVAFRAMPIGVGKTVFGNISANITTQGIWVVVNLCVPMWRRWGKVEGWQPVDLGVPGGHIGPPLWLGVVAFFVSLIYISVANILAHFVCGISKTVNDNTDPLEPAMCDKTRTMINQACLYTTGTLIMQHFNQRPDWAANVWWWSQVAFLGSAAAVMICQLGLSHIPCPCTDVSKFKSEAVNLLTLMFGYICGHFYSGWIETALKVTGWWWLLFAIIFQAVSLGFEEVRANCLVKLATENVEWLKLPS